MTAPLLHIDHQRAERCTPASSERGRPASFRRLQLQGRQERRFRFVFSLGTSAAPLLVLLTVSAAQASPPRALALAFAFGLGRGLPFLLIGLFAGTMVGFTRLGTWRREIQIASAAALLLVSFYYARAFVTLG